MNKDDYRLHVTLTPKQANLLASALELYLRLGIGQLEYGAEVINTLFATGCSPFADHNPIRDKMLEIKEGVLGLPRNGSHGITNTAVRPEVKTLYDTMKALEKGIATAEDHAPHSVWHDGDTLHLGDQPTPVVVLERDGTFTPVKADRHSR